MQRRPAPDDTTIRDADGQPCRHHRAAPARSSHDLAMDILQAAADRRPLLGLIHLYGDAVVAETRAELGR
jgi:hypothetical protein